VSPWRHSRSGRSRPATSSTAWPGPTPAASTSRGAHSAKSAGTNLASYASAAPTAALEAGRWEEARAAFAAALAEGETPEALDGMGAALWWLGETQAGVDHTERAYAEFRPPSPCA
jgi:hypothetical protein